MSIGFSVRNDVVNKATIEQLTTLHRDWRWINNGTPKRLLKALTNGYAVAPGQWTDGYKSKYKGEFISANYVMLDFDGGMTLEEAKNNEFIAETACFLYTSPSHMKPGKGERFRIVWCLEEPVTDWRQLDDVILSLRDKTGGKDDPAINAASCLFGSQPLDDNFYSHIWNLYSNRLDPKPLLEEQQQRRDLKRAEREASGYEDGELWEFDKDTCGEDRVALMVHCLKVQEDTGLRYVPDRQPTCTTFNLCWKVLGGLVHYFGVDLTYKIIEDADWFGDNSIGDWDIDRHIDDVSLREDLWIPGDEKWCSYTTVLKFASQELGNPDLTHDPGYYSPAMPKADFLQFKFQESELKLIEPTISTIVDNGLVSEEESKAYSKQVDEIVRLELSDNYQDNTKATLLKAKVSSLFRITLHTLERDVHKAAMTLMGIDLHGYRTSISMDSDDGGWEFNEDFEDAVEYQIPGVLPKNGTTALAGVGGTGKNKLAAYYGYRCVEGLPCIPHPEIPVQPIGKKILFIATDQAGGAMKRIGQDFLDAGATREWLQENVKIIAANPKKGTPAWTATTKNLCKLKQLMDTEKFGLVIIDSLKAVVAGTGTNMIDNNDMALLTRSLQLIVNPQASLLILNHAAEATKKFPNINEMQTASTFGQMIDAVFILRKPAEGDAYREMFGVKIRDNNEGKRFCFTANLATQELELMENSLSPDATRIDEILDAISDKKINGKAAPAGAAYIATQSALDIRSVSNYLVKLNSAKLVRRKGKGYLLTELGKRHLADLKSNTFSLGSNFQKPDF